MNQTENGLHETSIANPSQHYLIEIYSSVKHTVDSFFAGVCMGVCGSGKEYHLMSDIETFYTWPRTTPPPPPSLTIVPSEKTIDENCIQRQPSDKYTNTHKHTDMFNYAHKTIHKQKKTNANTHKQKNK